MATSPSDIFGTLGGGSEGAAPPSQLPASNAPTQTNPLQYVRDMGQAPDEQKPEEERVINKLKPDSDLHRDTLDKLNAMYNFSTKEMEKSYSRWNYAEQRIQAWTSVQDYERIMQPYNSPDSRMDLMPPEPISVIVPY